MVSLGKIHVEFDQELNDGLGGTITSANFPENYDHNTDCSFTILPVPGNHVTLQVTILYSPKHWGTRTLVPPPFFSGVS